MKTPDLLSARIVTATEKDLDEIAALAGVIWRKCYPGIISDAQINYMLERMYALGTMRDEIQSQNIRYERLLAGDAFIGFAAYGPVQPPSVYKLHKLYLHPDYHGKGLGSRLLSHCEKVIRDGGGRRLILAVNKQNTQAIEAYRRNGFSIEQTVVTEIGGGFVMDDYVMAKSI